MILNPHIDKEWSTLPHIMLTSDIDWDPTCLYCEVQVENGESFEAQSSFHDGTDSKLFNEFRERRSTSECHELHSLDTNTFKEDN